MAASGDNRAMELTFASYNIHKAVGLDRRRDPDRIINVLREIDADVIALQEADRRFGQRASVLPRASLDDHTPWRPPMDVRHRPRGRRLVVRQALPLLRA